MLNARSKWRIRGQVPQIEQMLCQELKLDPILARLLAQRGVKTVEEARQFLFFDPPVFHDPYLFRGMAEAVQRIREAIIHQERIRIYGDYDCDGVSSTALVSRLLAHLGAAYDAYIPHRVREGYGLNQDAVRQAAVDGITLLITVDTGISANPEIALANELGIDVLVTDHHEPPAILPAAGWIINPKVADCGYPYRELAGVGVALKLAQAMLEEVPHEWYQIAAVGTVADMMPLTDENRTIVHLGIESMRRSPLPGLQALLDVAGIRYDQVTASDIGFSIGPRINASGRMDAAQPALELYMSGTIESAMDWANELQQANSERQELVKTIAEQALGQVTPEMVAMDGVLIVKSVDWPMGVVGIVAARLMERFSRPVIVMRLDESTNEAKGSARAPKGIDLIGMLRELDHFFTHYGGHAVAAGLSLHQNDLAAFEMAIQAVAARRYGDQLLQWRTDLEVDGLAEAFTLTIDQIEKLAQMEPFGLGNPKPLFLWKEESVTDLLWMGKAKEHLKLRFGGLEAIRFKASAWKESLLPNHPLAFVGELGVNVWNGKKSIQIMIKDAAHPYPTIEQYHHPIGQMVSWDVSSKQWKMDDQSLTNENLHRVLMLQVSDRPHSEELESLRGWILAQSDLARIILRIVQTSDSSKEPMPTRDQWADLYRKVRSRAEWVDHTDTWQTWQESSQTTMERLTVMVTVFEQLNWLRRDGNLIINVPAHKRELSEASAYQKMERDCMGENGRSDTEPWDFVTWQNWIRQIYRARLAEGEQYGH